jgi:hypothetical protein
MDSLFPPMTERARRRDYLREWRELDTGLLIPGRRFWEGLGGECCQGSPIACSVCTGITPLSLKVQITGVTGDCSDSPNCSSLNNASGYVVTQLTSCLYEYLLPSTICSFDRVRVDFQSNQVLAYFQGSASRYIIWQDVETGTYDCNTVRNPPWWYDQNTACTGNGASCTITPL